MPLPILVSTIKEEKHDDEELHSFALGFSVYVCIYAQNMYIIFGMTQHAAAAH